MLWTPLNLCWEVPLFLLTRRIWKPSWSSQKSRHQAKHLQFPQRRACIPAVQSWLQLQSGALQQHLDSAMPDWRLFLPPPISYHLPNYTTCGQCRGPIKHWLECLGENPQGYQHSCIHINQHHQDDKQAHLRTNQCHWPRWRLRSSTRNKYHYTLSLNRKQLVKSEMSRACWQCHTKNGSTPS